MRKQIKEIVKKALNEAKKQQNWANFEMPEILIDTPKVESFGDYTTNIAMVLAKEIKKSPMEIAQAINLQLTRLAEDGESRRATYKLQEFEKIEVVSPGYINFYLSKKYLQDLVLEINEEKENYGNLQLKGKVNNEFISANPTGPLHLGNGRGGFYGDCLSRVLRKATIEVVNEYYINDAGEQVIKLGHSVLKDEQACYAGEYIDELAELFNKTKDVKEIGEKSAEYIVENIIKKTVKEKMNIEFDVWKREKELYENKNVEKAINKLKEKGITFEKDGALWLKSTEFGDDKDRVLIKSDGNKTYFASDCGYLFDKMERGFDTFVEIWGADHHGYIQRFSAAARALDFKGKLKFIIVQLVRLVKDGKEVRMSKRAGNVVYIDDLIEEIGHDAARFFFLMYSPDSHMNFDLGLAKERSQKNPVFYVQYAHARVCSIIAKAKEDFGIEIENEEKIKPNSLEFLSHEKELSLIKELHKFPELIEECATTFDIHKLPHYAIRLSDKFHSFYDACRVIDEKNKDLTKARLYLINAVRITLGETLRLIGVSAPEKM